jgi:hypothetical protein
MLPETCGKYVQIKLTHQASKDGKTVYHNIASTRKAT